MKTFPLIRRKISNEHYMALLFVTILLYEIPYWIDNPSNIPVFFIVVCIALLVDTSANLIRFGRPICSVSASVTAGIMLAVCKDVPMWALVIGVVFALIIGKHVWGGTGKNALNPAILAIFFISIFFHIDLRIFSDSLLFIPAILLSLFFVGFRPFACLGFMAGAIFALALNHNLDLENFIAYGVVFWGCLVIPDPVTMTTRPFTGAVGGLIAGFVPLFLREHSELYINVTEVALLILLLNVTSLLVGRNKIIPFLNPKAQIRIKKAVPYFNGSVEDIKTFGISNKNSVKKNVNGEVKAEDILKSIKESEIIGLGGAGYPTYSKIMTVIEASSSKKHFIINGTECDAGLIHDHWIIRNFTDEVYAGIELIGKCVGFDTVTLAVKDKKGIKADKNVKIHSVPDYYPFGAEKILIKQIIGKTSSPETIPAAEGILVLNVQTVYSIYRAFYYGDKGNERYITAADLRSKKSQIIRTASDVRIKDIADSIFPGQAPVLIGGGLMQASLAEADDIVGDTTNLIAIGDIPKFKESPSCSRCEKCSIHCPSGLNVSKISALVDEEKYGLLFKYHPQKCMGCGSCSYVCPAGRNLSERVKKARDYIRKAH